MWYSLRLDGMVFDPSQERRVVFLSGAESLDQILLRLLNRCEVAVDETSGRLQSGLMCALTAQLSLAQWASWSDFRRAEAQLGAVHPSTGLLTGIARSSMKSWRQGSSRTGREDSPQS